MRSEKIKNLVLAAMFFAIGLVLPLITGQIPEIAQRLSPMHLPVLLCGMICGWPYGLAVGFLLPVVRSLIFGMPVLFPNAVVMSFELAAYGFFAGLLYRLFLSAGWKKFFAVLVSLIVSMILGRIVWGAVSWLVFKLFGAGQQVTWAYFFTKEFVDAVPAIIMQIVLVPTIVLSLDRQKTVVFAPDKRNY